jgi:DNA-binding NarL/FixJ family response regulator
MLIEGVCTYLSKEKDINPDISVSATLEQCLIDLALKKPDILLLELSQPDGNGISFCKAIKHQYPGLRIVIFTDYKHWFTISYTIKQCRVSGYILKSAPLEELLYGIRVVMNNESFRCRKSDLSLRNTREPLWVTVREFQVLQYLGQGYTNKEIARKITEETKVPIAEMTVKDHRSNLRSKLGVDNTVSLLKLTMQMGLIWVEAVP